MKKPVWHNLPVNKVVSLLESRESGLTQQEAEERIGKFGLNELPRAIKETKLKLFLKQFASPLVYILLFACVVALVLQHWLDFFLVMGILIINAIIGFIQESKANDSFELLRSMISFNAKVMRDGHETIVPSDELVPGDVIILEAGDRVLADARVMRANNFEIMEANLTGESSPSVKVNSEFEIGTVLADRENMVYMSTDVVRGSAVAIVCDTGTHTQVGHIWSMIQETKEEKTPIQNELLGVGRFLVLITIAISLIIIVTGMLRHLPIFETVEGAETGVLYTSIAVAVAIIPESLIIAVTVILAIGMKRILEHKALVRKLIATQTLGSTSVICTDKTGTITEGKMKVAEIALPHKVYKSEDILFGPDSVNKKHFEKITLVSLLCNNAIIQNYEQDMTEWKIYGDSTEIALLTWGMEFGISKESLENEHKRIAEIPFDASYKMMATLNSYKDGTNIMCVKGAPENILQICKTDEYDHSKEALLGKKVQLIKDQYIELMKKGYRTVACAYKFVSMRTFTLDNVRGLVFLGLIGIQDPLRKEIKETYTIIKNAGIRTVIVTGDHKINTKYSALALGLKAQDENILNGKELDKMTDDDLYKIIKDIRIFARVSPHHKLRIINAWQKRGEVVAMTGDGVNDAPALKAADIGISLNSGTDVAKENSDLVLMDDNLKTIIEAIKEGRIIFENIKKVALYTLNDSFTEVTLILGSILFALPLPILPIQILWINLIEGSLPVMALTLESTEENVLSDLPRKKKEPILNAQMQRIIWITGLAYSLLLLSLFYFSVRRYYGFLNIEHIRTLVFTILSTSTLFFAYSCRSIKQSILKIPFLSNKYLNYSVILGMVLQLLTIYEPHFQKVFHTRNLRACDWGIVATLTVMNIAILEITKKIFPLRIHKK